MATADEIDAIANQLGTAIEGWYDQGLIQMIIAGDLLKFVPMLKEIASKARQQAVPSAQVDDDSPICPWCGRLLSHPLAQAEPQAPGRP